MNYHARRAPPTLLAVAAGLLACSSYIAASFIGMVYSHDLRMTGLSQWIVDRLKNGDISGAKVGVRRQLDFPSLDTRIVRFVDQRATEAPLEYTLKYIQVIDSVRAGQLERVLSARAFIQDEAPSAQDRPIREMILSELSGAEAAIESMTLLSDRKAESDQEAKRLAEDFLVISRRFGLLLNLEPEIPARGAPKLPVVESGYLQGLPRMTGLTEEVADVDEFAMVLKRIGGRVNLEGPQAAEAFEREIAEIRRLTAEISASFDKINDTLAADESSRNSRKKELDEIRTTLSRLIAGEIAKVTADRPEWFRRISDLRIQNTLNFDEFGLKVRNLVGTAWRQVSP